jgi:hypothetical protein
MADEQPTTGAPHEPIGEQSHEGETPAIDIERLTQKVYILMRDELRLEKARGAGQLRSR